MKALSIIRRALALLAVLGLVLGPMATSAMAMDGPLHVVVPATNHMDMGVASQDMPCCPHDLPTKDCAKDCPLMAVCVAQLIYPSANIAPAVMAFSLMAIVTPANDQVADSLAITPPPKPPKA